jgi:hypothetical protein
LALASETSNAKPYAIRRHFSHRKRSGIRRKRGFSELFAVSGYHRSGFEAKISQRSKALSRNIAVFDRPDKEGRRRVGRPKIMPPILRKSAAAGMLVLSGEIARAQRRPQPTST